MYLMNSSIIIALFRQKVDLSLLLCSCYRDLLRLRSSHTCWNSWRRSFSSLRTPLQLTLISRKSSWNVCRQVLLGRPFPLVLPSGTDCIATLAGLSGGRNICHVSVSLLTLTIFDRSCIPALFINSSLITWSRHEMPNMARKHLRRKTSDMCEISDVPRHVSAA